MSHGLFLFFIFTGWHIVLVWTVIWEGWFSSISREVVWSYGQLWTAAYQNGNCRRGSALQYDSVSLYFVLINPCFLFFKYFIYYITGLIVAFTALLLTVQPSNEFGVNRKKCNRNSTTFLGGWISPQTLFISWLTLCTAKFEAKFVLVSGLYSTSQTFIYFV